MSTATVEARLCIELGDAGAISFNTACAALGLDAVAVRRVILDGATA